MVRTDWWRTQLRLRYFLVWVVGSVLVAGAVSMVCVVTYRQLVAMFSENLFYPMVINVTILMQITAQKRFVLFSFFAGAVAMGLLINVLWSGCQMGDWRWIASVGAVMAIFGWLVWRGWRGILEMRVCNAIIWLSTVLATWQLIRPIFYH
jgi:hypothetical protein